MNEKTKKLFKWEGKKELIWILFFLLLFFLTYGYYKDTQACNEMLKSDCYLECKFYETVQGYSYNGIYATDCDYEANICYFAGIQKDISELNNLSDFNLNLSDFP